MKKIISVLLIIIIILSPAITAAADNSNVPEGFIPLREAFMQKREEGIFGSLFIDDVIIFYTPTDTIYIANASDKDLFFTFYRGFSLGFEYYIKEEKFLEIVEVAKLMPEQRLRTYSVGERIEIRGDMGKIYSMTILGVANNEIMFEVTPSISVENLRKVFNSIEINGRMLPNVVRVVTERTAQITSNIDVVMDVLNNHEVTAIQLSSPEYPGLKYRIVLNNEETEVVSEELTTADALAILRHVAGAETLSAQDLARYDFNENGNVDTSSALHVLRIVAGLAERATAD
jgi:hypothetical protein